MFENGDRPSVSARWSSYRVVYIVLTSITRIIYTAASGKVNEVEIRWLYDKTYESNIK